MSHCRLRGWSSARDWVGGHDGLPGFSIWQAGKMPLRSMAGSIRALREKRIRLGLRQPDSNH
jgi:hypothetical protein